MGSRAGQPPLPQELRPNIAPTASATRRGKDEPIRPSATSSRTSSGSRGWGARSTWRWVPPGGGGLAVFQGEPTSESSPLPRQSPSYTDRTIVNVPTTLLRNVRLSTCFFFSCSSDGTCPIALANALRTSCAPLVAANFSASPIRGRPVDVAIDHFRRASARP